MAMPFDAWRAELLRCGDIIQDADRSASDEERVTRFNRYTEMLDALAGDEGYEYALAIMESIRASDDYGAYQVAGHALWRFGEEAYCRAIIQELPRLIATLPDWAGDFLVSIANGQGTPDESTIHTFNRLLGAIDPNARSVIDGYIAGQEGSGGWLSDRVGVMGSNA